MTFKSAFATGQVKIPPLARWRGAFNSGILYEGIVFFFRCKHYFKKIILSRAHKKKEKLLTELFPPIETEPLPPQLQPLIAADGDEGSEVNATDPIVQLFLKRQRRMKEVKKRREAGALERLERFAVKKYYTMRRGWAPPSVVFTPKICFKKPK